MTSLSFIPSWTTYLTNFFIFGYSWKLQIVAFGVSLIDKLVAKNILVFNMFQRVPENFFYFISFIGGSPGLWISFSLLNHKIGKRKQGFRNRIFAAALLAPFLKYVCYR